jgi:hypothetical protein
MVAIALAPAAASAQEDGTVTISGLFSMDYMYGERDLDLGAPDLLAVYYNGHEHTWTLTLHDTTQSRYTNGAYYATNFFATSFDLEFFGPDAATLNGLVSDHHGGNAGVSLQNTYGHNGGGFAYMYFGVYCGDPGMQFHTGHDIVSDTLFPTNADGYPVVGPEPFSIEPDYIELGYFDMLSSTGGAIGSLAGLVTFSRPLPGDFNGDGSVDAADYVVWRKGVGTTYSQADYGVWRSHFGQSAGSGAALVSDGVDLVSVPEPTSVGLLLLVAATALLLTARRTSCNSHESSTCNPSTLCDYCAG